jgi:hypothetical protein
VNDVCLSAEQEGITVLHQGAEGVADVVVPERDRPAAVFEAALGVFVGSAGRLHHAVAGACRPRGRRIDVCADLIR